MSVKTHVQVVAITLMLLAIAVPTAVSVIVVRNDSRRQMAALLDGERDDVRSTLKNQVDLVLQTIANDYAEATHISYQRQVYGRMLQGVLTVLDGDIRRRIDDVRAGRMTRAAAQAEIASVVARLRFGSEDDYVWIQTDALPVPTMVMHPQRPDLTGKPLDSPAFDCARNRADNLFVAAVEVASAGGGFIDYLWERRLPDGGRQPNIPKISYVHRVPEWGWVLGSGVFVDQAVRESIERIKSRVNAYRYDNGTSAFWVHDRKGTILCSADPDLIGPREGDAGAPTFIKPSLETVRSGARDGFFEFVIPAPQPGAGRYLGYSRLFDQLGWFVGTSKNIDQLERKIGWRETEISSVLRSVILWNLLPLALFIALVLRLISRMSARLEEAGHGMTDEPAERDDTESPGRAGDEADDDPAVKQIRLLTSIQATLEKMADRMPPGGADDSKKSGSNAAGRDDRGGKSAS